jgi:hypothetical protein
MRKTSLASISVVVASAALVVPAASGAKKPSCPSKKEAKGCALKSGATYFGSAPGPGHGLRIVSDGSSFTFVDAFLPRERGEVPKQGSTCPGAVLTVKKKPRVGRAYAVKGTGFQPGIAYDVKAKVKFSSAKKAKVSGTVRAYAAHENPAPTFCTYSFSKTLKRVD